MSLIARAAPLWAAAIPLLAWAGGTPANGREGIERLALARARSELWTALSQLSLQPGLSPAQWAGRAPAADSALRLWARSRRPHAARFYHDGTCEVDVRAAPAELRDVLLRIHADHAERLGDQPGGEQIANAARSWSTLWCMGLACADETAPTATPGWEDVTPEGLELARQAAAAEALDALLAQAGALQVTAATRLNGILEGRAGMALVRERIAGAARFEVQTSIDQVARADATLRVDELIRLLAELRHGAHAPQELRAADFAEMALLNERACLRGSGSATPPAAATRPPPCACAVGEAPAWARRSLVVVGQAPADAAVPEKAALAARADAMRQVRAAIANIATDGGLTVQRALSYDSRLADDVELWFGALRVEPQPVEGGYVRVRVDVPLCRLWRVLRAAERGLRSPDLPAPLHEESP
jgi:hypothetical protein